MRRPRMRIWTLMIAVAVVALVAGFGAWMSRLGYDSGRYKQLAVVHAQKARDIRQDAKRRLQRLERITLRPEYDPGIQRLKKEMPHIEREAARHDALSEKYDRAARHPWLPPPQ
jgi:hypothetical protein